MAALLTDLYQLTMLDAYLREGMDRPAVFELFVRRLPPARHFLVAAGLEQALDFLEGLRFSDEEIAWLAGLDRFSPGLLEHLRGFRFTGDVDAAPEGTVFFADEPVLRITAPLPQAQLVESRLLNIVHFQTLVASKAARVVLAAAGRKLVDFGLRRAHGSEAALLAARAAFIAGFAGTATTEAGRLFGIPVFGTMAHSFVQVHDSEATAFEAFARAYGDTSTLLVDTYDTEAAIPKVVSVAERLAAEGIAIGGVRLDSGDLCAHAKAVRSMLDGAGFAGITIFASGDLDEHRIARLLADAAPIDGFGVGTALVTSSDVPALDAVYKLQAYAGVPRRKRSEGKATWPGAKQVVRIAGADGRMQHDVVQLGDEALRGEPLLQPVMRAGRRLDASPSLASVRGWHALQMRALPAPQRELGPAPPYPVEISQALRALAQQLDARQV
jgi:nicotinate phosphoribosyltransferase